MMPGCGAPMPPWACGELMPSGVRALCNACCGKPDPCSCEEALTLRGRLSIAARGTVAIHVVKELGCWTVELWTDGELRAIDGGVLTVAEALDRAGGFIRRSGLQANVTGKGEQR